MTPDGLTRLFAEPHRVRIFAAAALGATTPTDIAKLAGTSMRDTTLALRRFIDQEFLLEEPAGVRVNHDLFRELSRQRPAAPEVESHGHRDDRVEVVLRTFIRDGRLTRLPAQWSRKLVVLHHIAAHAFEPGVRYPEREVNDILRGWCDGGAVDHVTVRRYLVDLRLVRREDGIYWLNPDYRGDREMTQD
jgi:hypothetical protein